MAKHNDTNLLRRSTDKPVSIDLTGPELTAVLLSVSSSVMELLKAGNKIDDALVDALDTAQTKLAQARLKMVD